ncbi:LysM peptidoglycan-binding domain-containing protein [Sulfitobacter sp.]|uniref:LysM peptidoglycan-binding domain-containing protein n=1 Tax=Sulfitobacter sp. TaxID=1903071 RepID=UPI0030020EB3
MKAAKPKISFDATPQLSSVDKPFDREAWEKQLTEPKATKAPPRRVVVERIPKAPKFEATGLMAGPRPVFLQRNATPLAISSAVALTFLLGLASAIFWINGDTSAASESKASLLMSGKLLTGSEPIAEDATRAASSDLTDVSATFVSGVSLAPAPKDLSAVVLAGLQPTNDFEPEPLSSRPSTEGQSANKLRMLKEGVLAGDYKVQIYSLEGHDRVRLRFADTVATNEDVTGLLIEDLVQNQPDLAKALRTPSGAIDEDTLMFSLVHSALLNDQNVEATSAAREMSRKVFTVSPARSDNLGSVRLYTVKPGDSLAYISLQFYGLPDAYSRIIEANRDTLQSPDMIQLGQRLIIPS